MALRISEANADHNQVEKRRARQRDPVLSEVVAALNVKLVEVPGSIRPATDAHPPGLFLK